MKIVYLSYIYDPEGISFAAKRKALELLSRLPSSEFEVKFFWLNNAKPEKAADNSDTPDKFKKLFSRYLHEPNQFRRNWFFCRSVSKILRREKPDLVIARLDVHDLITIRLAKKHRVPLIFEIDNPVVYEHITFQPEYYVCKGLLYWIEKHNITRAEACFTVSSALKEYYRNRGIWDSKLTVITNGANFAHIHPEVRTDSIVRRYGLQNCITIGFVGTFHYWHGIENLMKLMERLANRHRDVKFLLVGGSGPLKSALQSFISKNNLMNRAFITGKVWDTEIPEYLAVMDIALAPYSNLPFFYYSPMKIFEYMAAGKAIVAAKIGQISEVITDGVTGLLFTPGKFEEFFQKVELLITNKELREKLGQAARETSAREHSWEKKAMQLADLCHNVAQRYRK